MPQGFPSDTELIRLAEVAAHCLAEAKPQPLRLATQRKLVPRWKRVLDVLCILVASPLLALVGLLIATAIKLLSRGPVFFRQERIGLLGKPFMCLKFRTMLVNADTSVHRGHLTELIHAKSPMTKLDAKGDPRLIPGGLWLRSFGLDELPQVINVLRGEMSMVGPRPCLPYEFEVYEAWHRQRCATLPGLTGFWQVNGKNRTTFEEMVKMDLHYVKHKSLALDVWIITKTIPAILGQVYDVKIRRRNINVS